MSARRKAKAAEEPRAKRRRPDSLANMADAINSTITDEKDSATRGEKVADTAKKPKASTRVGKKGLVLYVDPEVTKALRRLAALNNTDQQTLGLRGLELLFQEHGLRLPGASAKPAGKA